VTEKWGRYRYSKYIALNVEVRANAPHDDESHKPPLCAAQQKSLASRDAALEIAEAGLSWAHDNFEYVDAETKKVCHASAAHTAPLSLR